MAGDDQREQRVARLLEDCVRAEIVAGRAMSDLHLSDLDVDNLTSGVSSAILSGFAVDWQPDWIKPGDLHHWREGEDGDHHARCPVCLVDAPPQRSVLEAQVWVRRHQEQHAAESR